MLPSMNSSREPRVASAMVPSTPPDMQAYSMDDALQDLVMQALISEVHPVPDISTCADPEMMYAPMTYWQSDAVYSQGLDGSYLDVYAPQSDVGYPSHGANSGYTGRAAYYGSQFEAPRSVSTESRPPFVDCEYLEHTHDFYATSSTSHGMADFRPTPPSAVVAPMCTAPPQFMQGASSFAAPAVANACIMPQADSTPVDSILAMLDSEVDVMSLWAASKHDKIVAAPASVRTADGGLATFQHPPLAYRQPQPPDSSIALSTHLPLAPYTHHTSTASPCSSTTYYSSSSSSAPSTSQDSSAASSPCYAPASAPTPDPSTHPSPPATISASRPRPARKSRSHPLQKHAPVASRPHPETATPGAMSAAEARRWTCPDCPFVQLSKRKADFERHRQVHARTREWTCCGLPTWAAVGDDDDDDDGGCGGDGTGAGTGAGTGVGAGRVVVFEWQGVRLVGGCGKVYGRKDTYLKHLRIMGERGLCVGNAHAPWHSGNEGRGLARVREW